MPTPSQVDALLAAPELPEVAVLRIQPGDTIVVRVKNRLGDEQFHELRRQALTLTESCPGVHVAVMDGDADLVVLRAVDS